MNAATNPAPTAPEFTACALVRTITETVKVYRWDADASAHVCEGERTETREVGRVEFLPMGEWVLVRTVRYPGHHSGSGCWEAHKRDDARRWYKALATGGASGLYAGVWSAAEATTRIVGAVDRPARRVDYQWGETAYMFTFVDLPAMRVPVIAMERGRECAVQPFVLKTQPTPGDRYGHTSNRIEFHEVKRASVAA